LNSDAGASESESISLGGRLRKGSDLVGAVDWFH